jgi:metallo-beta-lactamase family protein
MFQGSRDSRMRNERPFPFEPAEIDYVILTHAHIDHSGLLPKLAKEGFRGEILAHKATNDLAKIMLPDSAHIQQMEAEWSTRKNKRAGLEAVEPIYTIEDTNKALSLFRSVPYYEKVQLADDLWFKFHNAGHILGSCLVELGATSGTEEQIIVFSGDLGVKGRPIIQDPDTVAAADFVIIESTYGDRLHESEEEKERRLTEILRQACRDKEKVVIPAFAVGRTQEILYEINKLYHEEKIPLIPVYIDSPLAVSATEIFEQNSELFDEETWEFLHASQSPFNYPKLTLVRDVQDSISLNTMEGPAVIISASGMAEAGRIKHHLKHNLWRESAHVLFIGYQGEGTLGRRLRDGAPSVSIFGEEIAVRAQIHAIDGFSAHADQKGLMDWLQAFSGKPRGVFVTHGEKTASQTLATLIKEKLNLSAVIPQCGQSYDLSKGDALAHIAKPPIAADSPVSELDALWREARTLIAEQLQEGGKKELKEARRLAQRLEELMREVRNKLR